VWARNVLFELAQLHEIQFARAVGLNSTNHALTRLSENLLLPLFHSRSQTLISLCNWGPLIENQLIVIHDIAPIRYPEFFNKNYSNLATIMLPKLLNKAQIIGTVSEFTKNEIVNVFSINEEKIQVFGGSTRRKQQTGNSIPPPTMTNFSKYMLFLGAHDPRKNLDFLLDIWSSVYQQTGISLLVTGIPNSKVFTRNNSKETKGIEYLGFVEESQIENLMIGAMCLLSPSIYEGFGLPIVEALKFGTHVIANKTGVVEEIDSPGITVLPLISDLWHEAIVEFNATKFEFDWYDWDLVASKISKNFTKLDEEMNEN
jgi:glycosyltransferase involved in cell wall biosynthesis